MTFAVVKMNSLILAIAEIEEGEVKKIAVNIVGARSFDLGV